MAVVRRKYPHRATLCIECAVRRAEVWNRAQVMASKQYKSERQALARARAGGMD